MKRSKEDKNAVQFTEDEIDKKFDEFKKAVGEIDRARFRVRPDLKSDAFGIMLFLLIIISAGSLVAQISKNKTGAIIVAVITSVAVVIAIGVMISYLVRSKKVYYCYYAKTERGVFCMSVIGDNATVFAGGVAYRIECDKFYTLDAEGYRLWLDGEGTGLYSLSECTRDMFEVIDEQTFFVNNEKGGGHEVHFADGKIQSIIGVQPYTSDTLDPKTGERKIKARIFEKTDMTTDFEWVVPEFVKSAFDGARTDLPDMNGL